MKLLLLRSLLALFLFGAFVYVALFGFFIWAMATGGRPRTQGFDLALGIDTRPWPVRLAALALLLLALFVSGKLLKKPPVRT